MSTKIKVSPTFAQPEECSNKKRVPAPCFYLMILACALPAPRVSAQVRPTDLPIAVTSIPVGSGHSGSVDQRIVVIENPLSAHPKTRVLKFQDPLLSDGIGTQLQNWLDGGRRATVYRITSSNVAGCTTPPQEPKCVRLEPFVVNVLTGQTISRPTALFQHDHPTALYNEGLQPLSDANDKRKISSYIFLTHPGLTQDHPQDKPEMWRVKTDGTDAAPVANPYLDTGSHGCQVSPDGQFLACEPPPRYSLGEHGIRLSLIDGTKPTYIKQNEEKIGLGFVAWSPDSTGVVYYSFSNSGDRGWLIYCHIDREKLHSEDQKEREKSLEYHILAPDIVPSQYCKGTSGDLASPPPCRPYGTGNIGSDLPVWSPDSRWVYYSALMRSTSNELPQRVIGRVLISRPKIFEPLTLQIAREAGHPAISPNGGAIAFLATTSTTDSRVQTFVLVVKTRRTRQLTSFGPDQEGYAPQWWSWPTARKP